jgi:hypothetical protein
MSFPEWSEAIVAAVRSYIRRRGAVRIGKRLVVIRHGELEVTNGGASDDHSDPARRAYRVRCLAYALRSPALRLLESSKAKERDDQSCQRFYQTQRANWIQILRYAKARSVPQRY